jgi:DNA-binding transcriptional ArsR family regulator
LFLVNRSAVLIDADREGGQPILSFAAPPDLKAANELWEEYDRGDEALSALVGRTRAAVLLALADNSSTTGELADRLSVSAAAISQHTGVLRAAGLISTRRNRNMVLHTLNSLGNALLSGDSLDGVHPAAISPSQRGRVDRHFSAS